MVRTKIPIGPRFAKRWSQHKKSPGASVLSGGYPRCRGERKSTKPKQAVVGPKWLAKTKTVKE